MARFVSSRVAIGSPRWWPTKVLASLGVASCGSVGEPVAVTGGGDYVGVLAEPVEQRHRGGLTGRNRPQFSNGECGAIATEGSFVGGGDEPEHELAAGVVERGEADLVDDNQLVAAHGLDGASDGVVGDGAVVNRPALAA